MSTTTEILFNSPALHSLKRDQLIKLCKIHNIKANGKNVDLIERLKLHASSLPPDAPSLNLPLGSDFDELLKSPEPVVFRSMPRPSEQWEVVMDDIEEASESSGTLNSMRTVTGNKTGEFGTVTSKSSSVGSSLRAFATSLGIRRAMETPSTTEPLPQPSSDTLPPSSEYDAPIPGNPSLPGAPAPSHARMSLTDPIESTTIRLVSNSVTYSDPFPTPPRLQPFKTSFDLVMGSPRSSAPKWPASPFKTAGPDSIYPALPLDEDISGSLPSSSTLVQTSEPFTDVFSSPATAARINPLSPPRAEPFLFGSPLPQHRLSNQDFGAAASSVLDEMNKRLGLTGDRKVGLDVLANRDKPTIGLPSGGTAKKDVFGFDKAHDEAFKKMDSIANHYAAKRPVSGKTETEGTVPGSKKRKSEALGTDNTQPNAKRTSIFPTRKNVVPGGFGEEEEELEPEENRRMSKRPRVVAEDKDTEVAQPAQTVKDEEAARKAREIEAVRRKAEARRRSSRVTQGINTGLARQSVGRRSSVAPGKNKLNKGSTSRFGFLSSAKNLVKSVWKGNSDTTKAAVAASSIPVASKLAKPEPTLKTASTSSKTSMATSSRPSVSSKSSTIPRNRFDSGTSTIASTSGTPKTGSATGTLSTGQKQATPLAGSNTTVRIRTTSTLMAPTASSLAKMQSNHRLTTKLESQQLKRPSHSKLSMQPTLPETPATSPPSRIFHQPLTTDTFARPSKIPVPTSFTEPAAGPSSEAVKHKQIARRPRISRSRVIAKLGAQRVAANTTPIRSSIGTGKVRSSLGDGVRKSYGGAKTRTSGSADALMSAKKKARASEYVRRRSRAGQAGDVEMKDG